MPSKIEWTDSTWNPVTGCTPISEGCENCYAKRMAKRLQTMGQMKYRNGFTVTCHPHALEEPLHWRKPQNIFVCSMSDLFHDDVPFEFIDRIIDVFNKCPQHTGQLLTKRAKRMYEYAEYRNLEWPENVIGMVTAENQKQANLRIPYLLRCGFKTTAVSIEPCLGWVDFNTMTHIWNPRDSDMYLSGIHWVIVGAETGPNARPMMVDWARNLLAQCQETNVPFFYKRDSVGSRLLDGREWNERPAQKAKANPAGKDVE